MRKVTLYLLSGLYAELIEAETPLGRIFLGQKSWGVWFFFWAAEGGGKNPFLL